MKQRYVHSITLLILITIATIAVGVMVKDFIMVIFLAALTSAMVQPLFRWFMKRFNLKEGSASMLSLFSMIIGGLTPLIIIIGIFVGQAIQVSQTLQPKIKQIIESENSVEQFIAKIPHGDLILTYQDQIIEKAGKVANSVALFVADNLKDFTFNAVQSMFLFFLYLYTLFFLIKDGRKLLHTILFYLPLPSEQETRLLQRFTSVTKATLKGTVLIGIIQGALAGIALALAGVESSFFWSILMMILSVIPVVGTILVWLPAGIVLILSGSTVAGILVLLWCGIVVGNIDNLLRPKLVGQDAGLHELLILFSTLGGLSLFGVTGFILGPILAALWVTLWDMYGEMFGSFLPAVESEGPLPESQPADLLPLFSEELQESLEETESEPTNTTEDK